MTNLAPRPKQRFYDNNGRPLASGQLFTYQNGTTTKTATYRNKAAALNTNPIILNARGECDLWLDPSQSITLTLAPATDTDPPTNPIFTQDDIAAPLTISDINPQTPAETAASATVVNILFPEGHVDRYGTNTTPGTTDMQGAMNTARLVMAQYPNGGVVQFQPGQSYRHTAALAMSAGITLDGRNAKLLASGCDGISLNFSTYLSQTKIRDLFISSASGGATHVGINNPGTLDHNDQLYGLTIEDCIVTGFNVGIHFRSVWYSAILNTRVENCDRGIEIIGQCIKIDIVGGKVINDAPPGGSGVSAGIIVDAFNYTSSGGLLPPEGIQILDTNVFGFTTGINAKTCHYLNIDTCDLEASSVGIDFTSVDLIFNITNTYVEVDGAAGVAGIFGRSLGTGPLATKVNIKNVHCFASGTSTASGLIINSAVGQDQNFVTVEDCYFAGWNTNDIQFNNAGSGWIIRNRCQSSGPTNSILATGVLSGTLHVTQNLCTKAISTTAADETAGRMLRYDNIVSATTFENYSGVWVTPAFSAGDYTANGLMTWTVGSGDVVTCEYMINRKTMTVNFALNTTTVGGTLNTTLKIAIPAGKTSAKQAYNAIGYLNDNGTIRNGIVSVAAGGTTINIDRQDAANFTAATDATYVKGQITFEIN